jgi:hypothetical protein
MVAGSRYADKLCAVLPRHAQMVAENGKEWSKVQIALA